ncbi:MAG TPA: glycosyltransferase family 2 protein [Gemmatimonadaceae bacterium]
MTARLQGLTAVIPALNEIATIGRVVSGVREVAECVIVVDDGSTDGTGDAARAAGAVVVRHDRPLGYDTAIAEGLNEAFRLGAVAAITTDADGQHRIDDVRRVAQPVLAGGRAFSAGVRDHYNRAVEGLLGIVARPLYGTRDPFCGLKCYHRTLFERMGPFPSGMNVGSLPLAWVRRNRLSAEFIPITSGARHDQPRFGTMFRASAKLAVAFFRTLWADLTYTSSARRA